MSAHTNLVAACISYINARGGYAWKNQTGVFKLGTRYVHSGRAGVPDVIGVLPRSCATCRGVGHAVDIRNGILIAVEVKTGLGRLSPTQKRVHAELARRGALVLTVRSIADLEAALR